MKLKQKIYLITGLYLAFSLIACQEIQDSTNRNSQAVNNQNNNSLKNLKTNLEVAKKFASGAASEDELVDTFKATIKTKSDAVELAKLRDGDDHYLSFILQGKMSFTLSHLIQEFLTELSPDSAKDFASKKLAHLSNLTPIELLKDSSKRPVDEKPTENLAVQSVLVHFGASSPVKKDQVDLMIANETIKDNESYNEFLLNYSMLPEADQNAIFTDANIKKVLGTMKKIGDKKQKLNVSMSFLEKIFFELQAKQKKSHPSESDEQIFERTNKYVADNLADAVMPVLKDLLKENNPGDGPFVSKMRELVKVFPTIFKLFDAVDTDEYGRLFDALFFGGNVTDKDFIAAVEGMLKLSIPKALRNVVRTKIIANQAHPTVQQAMQQCLDNKLLKLKPSMKDGKEVNYLLLFDN